ncbi:hypothetical protein FVE85_7397 [Porphyridium purpureum]|uniref:Homeobox domain-containing protein n=1 Tax=Porphyridium purpureum TaxID=35688 RepID=A0A5J4Z9W5_PORPP|nr:hypothetical protein FVE85_7397 [Porphyridium purpureum]|eukprot:POR1621..scf295_1
MERQHGKASSYGIFSQSNKENIHMAEQNVIDWMLRAAEAVENAPLSLKKGSSEFSPSELEGMARLFEACPYPKKDELESLAASFGKPLRKVRTWFNNRRAKQVRMRRQAASPDSTGSDTPRSDVGDSPSRHATLESTAKRQDSFPLRSGSPSANVKTSEANSHRFQAQKNSASSLPLDTASQNESHVHDAASAVPPSESLRKRKAWRIDEQSSASSSKTPAALSLHRTKLAIGSKWACESLVQTFADKEWSTLEIKFLFGRRKLRYELFLGDDLASAMQKGGPYGAIDIKFSSIDSFSFEEDALHYVYLNLVVNPRELEYLLQPQSNFEEYKNRTKQRLYEKENAGDFTRDQVASLSRNHRIWVGKSTKSTCRVLQQHLRQFLVSDESEKFPMEECYTPSNSTHADPLRSSVSKSHVFRTVAPKDASSSYRGAKAPHTEPILDVEDHDSDFVTPAKKRQATGVSFAYTLGRMPCLPPIQSFDTVPASTLMKPAWSRAAALDVRPPPRPPLSHIHTSPFTPHNFLN